MASNPAPGELELVRAFVNTYDAEERREDLTGPQALAAWLTGHELLGPYEAATAGDVRRAVAVREALRAVLLHHAGLELDPGAAAALDEAARRARVEGRFDAGARGRLEPAAGGVDGALGRLLAIVARARADGTWERLKVCLADDCQWAYYDRSRNRSSVWCDMRVCGNRAKVRSYRERRTAGMAR